MSKEARAWFATGAILLVGFTSAVAIYLVNPVPDQTSGYGFEDTKQYLREVELYGGYANVLASEIRTWFVGLWYGRSLAYTVAVITVFVALVYRLATIPLPPLDADAARQPNDATSGTRGSDNPATDRHVNRR